MDKERNTESGSVGIGLYISRSIIESCGGIIQAEQGDPGLKVTITLPLI